jgi:hypothetical protein
VQRRKEVHSHNSDRFAALLGDKHRRARTLPHSLDSFWDFARVAWIAELI